MGKSHCALLRGINVNGVDLGKTKGRSARNALPFCMSIFSCPKLPHSKCGWRP